MLKISLITNLKLAKAVSMDIIQVITLSIVEGVTEFLPISSTGHMIVLSRLLNIPQNSIHINFEITIQLSAILAVCYQYAEKLRKSLNLWKKIIVSFIPTGVVGLLFYKEIINLFSVTTVALSFILGGIVFLIVEKFYRENKSTTKSLEDITYRQSLIVGIAQVFSLIPGTSRSGATIVGGLLSNLDRKTATEFSFLCAIPVMLTATLFSIYKNLGKLNTGDIYSLILGFVITFFITLITVRLFLKYVKRYNFVPFGIYRIVFGLILLLFFSN
ncbi:undecaprenyl-diphosphatase [Methanofervidicoccus abyssi]|uniref:Undecaprenyl-diphosphatase n=2 Tax=Methanofervidicoccus abyssi TaxID=2082189 RepID=A0A401HNW7_9EURY|nr:undecaprenyl-diphosphatase [Methanofervidicoccus abyssi]